MKTSTVTVIVTALSLGGCANNPYITNTRPVPSPEAAAAATQAARGSLPYALAYADATYDAYDAKLGEELTRQQQLSGGLLTLGTLALGAAVGHAHRDVLIGLGLGGGLAYQLGSWNSNQGRLGIYVEGMKAISCAKAAVAPLQLGPDARRRIGAAETAVGEALRPTASALSDTTRWLAAAASATAANAALLQSARAEIADTNAALVQAGALLGRSAALAQKADGAGALLESKVDEIRRLIAAALNGTLAQLSSLPQQISSIAGYANLFAPGLQLGAAFSSRIDEINGQINKAKPGGTAEARSNRQPLSAEAAASPEDNLAVALGRLRGARALLEPQLAALSGAIDRSVSQVQADLSGCSVDSAQLSTGLTLDRSTVVLVAGQAGLARVGISGGTTPYVAAALDTPTKGINVLVPPGSAQVEVVADTGTVAGASYQVKVEDSAKHSVLLTVKVEGKAEPAAEPPAPATTCRGFEGRSRALICLVQRAVGAKQDGGMGPDTCKSFLASDIGKSSSGLFNDDTLKQVLATAQLSSPASDEAIRAKFSSQELQGCGLSASNSESRKTPNPAGRKDARNDVERRLSDDEIKVLSKKLQMPAPATALGDEFRRALASWQKANGLPDTQGELNDELLKKLMNQ
jgi:hypothetical protein